MKKKRQENKKIPRIIFKGFTSKDIELLKTASQREPSKYKKQKLIIFKCKDCSQMHYYRIGKCVLCGCNRIEVIKNHIPRY
jgi:TATA-box binding protein (TBP) (component of TFIID and TFIIIB)